MVISYNCACFGLKTSKRKRWLEIDKKVFTQPISVEFWSLQEKKTDQTEIKQVLWISVEEYLLVIITIAIATKSNDRQQAKWTVKSGKENLSKLHLQDEFHP